MLDVIAVQPASNTVLFRLVNYRLVNYRIHTQVI